MPEIVSNGNAGEEPKVESETHHGIPVDIETLKHAAKIESANLIAAERHENETEIPLIEIETAPPVADEPEPLHTNGNGAMDSEPVEHQNGNTVPESLIDIADEPKENGNGHLEECDDQTNEEPEYDYVQQSAKSHEQDVVCTIVPPSPPQTEESEPQDPEPEVLEPEEPEREVLEPVSHDQPELICSLIKNDQPVLQRKVESKEEPEAEDDYREPVVCEMRAKFTEPKVQNEAPVTNGAGAKKVVLNTKLDTASLKKSYEAVRSDQDETEWAVFKFDGSILTTKATGTDFLSFQKQFGEAERAFGYIRIQTGDEMSKRQKFLLVTWIGPEVSVLQRAKMSTDKAFVKTVVSNFAVELQPETASEINMDHFVAELDKAGGAHYGTGV